MLQRRRIDLLLDASLWTSSAARRFEAKGLETLERSERLATASYEAGAVPLGELLALRRELVQAQRDDADLLLGAATARAEWAASMGAHRCPPPNPGSPGDHERQTSMRHASISRVAITGETSP